MYCAECGTANSIGAETCEVCGSPLGPSSGEKTCHACGAPINDNDRFCRSCGQSQSGADAGRFEAGPSFVDDSNLEIDPGELPPWLREMTIAKTQKENGHLAASAAVVEQSESLPSWMDSTTNGNGTGRRPAPYAPTASSGPSAPVDEPAESFSLISEDDLPEWLRALGDQEFEETTPSPVPVSSRSATPQNVATSTPTISRAWLSRPREVGTESTGDVAADFAPLETGPTANLTRRQTPQTDELSLGQTEIHEEATPRVVVEESDQTNNRRMRWVMLSVVLLLVVILGVFAVSNLL